MRLRKMAQVENVSGCSGQVVEARYDIAKSLFGPQMTQRVTSNHRHESLGRDRVDIWYRKRMGAGGEDQRGNVPSLKGIVLMGVGGIGSRLVGRDI